MELKTGEPIVIKSTARRDTIEKWTVQEWETKWNIEYRRGDQRKR